MTLLTESACGLRTPTLRRLPLGEPDYALADDVLAWLDAVNIKLFPWQSDVLRESLAVTDGKWSAYEVSLAVARQNGKNEILAALEFASVGLLRNRLVVHSAHESATAQKHFQRMQDIAERNLEIRKLLPNTKTLGFYTSNGKEHIRFRNGGIIEFTARTKSSARGFSSDLVVLDEAFDLNPRAVGSMMYTLRARVNPQVWRTSSPAHADSVVMHNDRRRAQADDPDDRRFMYVEWANEPDCDPSSPEVWLRSSPSIGAVAPGFELELETFRNEYASAKDSPELLSEFVREVCGVPDAPLSDLNPGPIAIERWQSLTDGDSLPLDDTVRLALDVTPDRRFATFGIAGKRADGLGHVSVRHREPGTTWVVDRAKVLADGHNTPIIVVKGSPAESMIPDLELAGVPVDVMSAADYAGACQRFVDAVNAQEPLLRHRGSPDHTAAVSAAQIKPAGDGGFVWSRRTTSADITPLTSVTAAWGRVGHGAAAYAGGFVDLSDYLED